MTMTVQCTPEKKKIASWVVYKCVNIITENEYSRYVEAERDNKRAWAVEMLKSVEEVKGFILYWCRHMDLVAKRDNSGISRVCKIVQNSLPISKSHAVFTLQDCVLTGMKARPCFEIISNRDPSTSIHVHHSTLEKCQSLWAISNSEQILGFSMRLFSEKFETKNLSEMCENLDQSETKETLVDFFHYAFKQVYLTFREENLFQPGICGGQMAKP